GGSRRSKGPTPGSGPRWRSWCAAASRCRSRWTTRACARGWPRACLASTRNRELCGFCLRGGIKALQVAAITAEELGEFIERHGLGITEALNFIAFIFRQEI